MLNRYLDIAPEVKKALDEGKPVVALESTIISHGMPYPQNAETALQVEKIIRDCGAVPATIAIIGGRLKAGLTADEIDYLGKAGHAVAKASLELIWEPGAAQVDFGEADFIVQGIRTRLKYLVVSFPYSNDSFCQVFGGENSECVCQGL